MGEDCNARSLAGDPCTMRTAHPVQLLTVSPSLLDLHGPWYPLVGQPQFYYYSTHCVLSIFLHFTCGIYVG